MNSFRKQGPLLNSSYDGSHNLTAKQDKGLQEKKTTDLYFFVDIDVKLLNKILAIQIQQ